MKWVLSQILTICYLLCRLARPDGAKSIISENLILKQQLQVLARSRQRCPPLLTRDRIVFAFCSMFLTPKRIHRASIAVASSTILRFHKSLVKRKYSRLFGQKRRQKTPGPKGPSKKLIQFIVEMKEKNPGYGCPKIALLASNVLETTINESLVRRILKKHYKPQPGGGPSWLIPIGFAPNQLWSVDLFRVESIFLQSYWILLVMDQYTRRIIGFSVHKGNVSGGSLCFMFNKIVVDKAPPKHLSSDNDPLFKYWLWQANLEHFGIDEIKTVPYCPWSHPFIERKIGSCRREFFDRALVYSKFDIESKFSSYVDYFNKYRVHSAHGGLTPNEKNGRRDLEKVDVENYGWKSTCGGMYHTPMAA